ELALLRSQDNVEWLDEGETSAGSLPRQVLKAMVEASEADQGLLVLWGPDGARVDAGPGGDTAQSMVRYHQDLLIECYPEQVTPCFVGAGLKSDPMRWCPACKDGQPLVHSEDGRAGRAHCLQSLEGARDAVCVPLVAGERTLGVASLRYHRPQPVPSRPLALLGAMAPRASRVFLGLWPQLTVERPAGGAVVPGRAMEGRTVAVEPSRRAEEVSPVQTERRETALFLDIRCFGTFRVMRDGMPLSPASFGRRQSYSVLKMLVTRRGRPTSAEYLTETLWPEADPEAANKRLWVVIHGLRMGLEPGLKSGQHSHFVHRSGDSYLFSPEVPYRLDLEDFLGGTARGERLEIEGDPKGAAEAYQEAAKLYVGDFLEDEAYSDWCSAEREYLREIFLSLLKRLAAIHAGWEDWDRSIAWHRKALYVDGLREEVHRELMRCLWRAGRRDEALRQYQECRQVLDRELGVEPLPETEQLYRDILQEEKLR
ncbi:MAG TPA: BTAD domain-containing putative transcriptional regulator, partial [Dehalococcoidia bacterium]|nr:BTAD domain-containing putative transcriptional regulator [Dehalococcoidia bacterium]